jgi:hypothetical protein
MSVEELRTWYRSLSDHALREAYVQGSGSFTAEAWRVISEEVEDRGMSMFAAMEADDGTTPSGGSGIVQAQSLTREEVHYLTLRLLEAGESPADVRASLQQRGLEAIEAEQAITSVFPVWRKEAENDAGRQMLSGALWGGAGAFVWFWTYSSAQSQGGTYIVAWGPVLYGIVTFFRGLARFDRLGDSAGGP